MKTLITILLTIILTLTMVLSCGNKKRNENATKTNHADLYIGKYDGCTYITRASSYAGVTHHKACKNPKHN